MDKLRDNTTSVNAIQKINESINLSARQVNENTDFSVTSSVKERNTSNSNDINETSTCNRQKKIPFSEMEDKFLREGIKKYGGKWKSILDDPNLKFHTSTKPATLCTRAKTRGFV